MERTMVGSEYGGCLSFSARVQTYQTGISKAVTDLAILITYKRCLAAALNSIKSYHKGSINPGCVLTFGPLLQLLENKFKADVRLVIYNVRHDMCKEMMKTEDGSSRFE